MSRTRLISPFLLAIVVAIGCGSGKPQDAAADRAVDEQITPGISGVPQHADAAATPDVDSSSPDLQLAKAPIELAEAPADAPAAAPAAAGGTASITGTMHYEGPPATGEKVKMDADPVCKQQHATPVQMEDLVVANGALKNVFVYVKEGLTGTYPAPSTPVVLDQAGCWYSPHVLGIQVGQSLQIQNSDATLHNINAKPVANTPFNVAQPVRGMKTSKSFQKPEIGVKFKCNVHPWMTAYAGVVNNPFFSVSAADGTFTIKDLPAGTYVIEAWHEKLGTQTQTVTVGDGESKAAEFTFKAQ